MHHSALRSAFARLSLAAALGVAPASTALAGPPEVLGVMTQHPTQPKTFLLNYENALGGLLHSTDGGKTLRIHPAMAFTQTGLRELVFPLFQKDGTLLLPTRDGLFVSEDVCLKPHPLTLVDMPREASESAATAVAAHPSEDNVAFYLTNDASASRSGLWRRDADGKVSAYGAANDGNTFDARDLRVLARPESAGGLRFLELGRKAGKPMLRISDTQGDSWQELPIDVPNTDNGYPRFLAVVAGEPLKLVIVVEKTGNPDPNDLVLYSSNGGQSYTTYAQPLNRVVQSLITPDGRLFLADQGGNSATAGLWMAASVGEAPTKLVDYPVHCLGYDAEAKALFLCKGYELGHFDPATKSFCRIFQMNEVRDFVCSPATLPTPEGASTTTTVRVKDQMCQGWCGAAHYASAPLCAYYNVTTPACGIGARAYDMMGPEELRWVEPPGTQETRCAGYEPRLDMPDASLPEQPDASSADAQANSADGDAGAESDAGQASAGGKSGGDGCSVGARGSSQGALALLTALSMLMVVRRRRRARG